MKGWTEIVHVDGEQNRKGLAMLIANKVDSRQKLSQEAKKTLCNDTAINQPGRYNYKYVCI